MQYLVAHINPRPRLVLSQQCNRIRDGADHATVAQVQLGFDEMFRRVHHARRNHERGALFRRRALSFGQGAQAPSPGNDVQGMSSGLPGDEASEGFRVELSPSDVGYRSLD